jgi:hypothetical protein
LVFAATTLVLAPVGFLSMFSVFQPYDDEGFQLLTLDGYVSGRALYTELVTYHGPFFYEFMGGFFKLTGLQVSNDSGRLITLFIWLLASLACGLVVRRLTSSLTLAISSQLLTFNLLAPLINEPMQPGGLLGLLLLGLAAAAAYRSPRPRATAALIGAMVAAACLVKINVGAFAVLAVAFAFAATLTARWRRLLVPVTGLLLIVAPFPLMLKLLDRDWVVYYALAAALAATALVIVVYAGGPKRVVAPAPWWIIGGGSAVAIAAIGIAVVGGTKLSDLANAIVLVAYRQPQVYIQPLNLKLWVVVCAAISTGLAIAIAGLRARRPASPIVSGVGRIAAGVLIWICVLLPPSYLLMLAVALVWVAALPPSGDHSSPTEPHARLLLPALALMESLQAYPVAGTQLSIAAMGVVLVGAVIINDGLTQVRSVAAGTGRVRLAAATNFVPVAALILSVAATALWGLLAAGSYEAGSPLGLPGAGLLRVPSTQQGVLRSLTASLRRDCTSFITMPGMPSLYVWTGQKAPVLLYDSMWIYLLDSAQQQSIVDQASRLRGMCVVKNQAEVNFWAKGRSGPSGPLVDFINTKFAVSSTYGDYEVLTRVDVAG